MLKQTRLCWWTPLHREYTLTILSISKQGLQYFIYNQTWHQPLIQLDSERHCLCHQVKLFIFFTECKWIETCFWCIKIQLITDSNGERCIKASDRLPVWFLGWGILCSSSILFQSILTLHYPEWRRPCMCGLLSIHFLLFKSIPVLISHLSIYFHYV